jgi:pyruvate/2-oxoglutarate dehydrogenase complex dihydrolipoamide acyltransferase (E2) component
MCDRIAVSIPRETVNDETVRILAWKCGSGTRVEKDQLVCEVETSKAVMEIHAPAAGRLEYSAVPGEDLPIGETICHIVEDESEIRETALHPPPAPSRAAVRLSAAARSAAERHGVDVASFPAGMLVRRQDVLRQAGVPDRLAVQWTDLPRRKLTEGRILDSGRAGVIPSSVTCMFPLGQLPARLLPLIIFEAARLLRRYPEFNAIHNQGRIGHYEHIHIGWALDGGEGLVVPVIESADTKDIGEIVAVQERQIAAYIGRSFSLEDLLPATFTISDLSGYGVSFFLPLILRGQSAILGVGKDGDGLSLTLAFDHRLSDGRRAALFLRELSERLQSHGAVLPPPQPHCVICQRDVETLQRHKLVLLPSAVPAGYVCSLCVAGWR